MMQARAKNAWLGVGALGTFLALVSVSPAEGVGTCREVNCGQGTPPPAQKSAPTPTRKQPPKESDWKACRKQDTFKGCCQNYYGGRYRATGSTGVSACCWEGTPSDAQKGSTTAIEAAGGDVFQPDLNGRSCRRQGFP